MAKALSEFKAKVVQAPASEADSVLLEIISQALKPKLATSISPGCPSPMLPTPAQKKGLHHG